MHPSVLIIGVLASAYAVVDIYIIYELIRPFKKWGQVLATILFCAASGFLWFEARRDIYSAPALLVCGILVALFLPLARLVLQFFRKEKSHNLVLRSVNHTVKRSSFFVLIISVLGLCLGWCPD